MECQRQSHNSSTSPSPPSITTDAARANNKLHLQCRRTASPRSPIHSTRRRTTSTIRRTMSPIINADRAPPRASPMTPSTGSRPIEIPKVDRRLSATTMRTARTEIHLSRWHGTDTYTYGKLDLASYLDRQGRLWTYTHDADRRLQHRSVDPFGQIDAVRLQGIGEFTSLTIPKGNSHQLELRRAGPAHLQAQCQWQHRDLASEHRQAA